MGLMKTITTAIAGLSALVLAACASGGAPQSSTSNAGPQTTASQSASTSNSNATADPTSAYRLNSGDQIKITVFDEPDLSGPFELDGDGLISMSLIGEVEAKDLTIRELQREIEAKLRDGFLRNPQVSAEVVTYRPFYILGEVNNPGEYPYTAGLTVMNAIASAGDFTYRADKKKVLITSENSGIEREIGLTVSTQVQPGDTIRIRERFF